MAHFWEICSNVLKCHNQQCWILFFRVILTPLFLLAFCDIWQKEKAGQKMEQKSWLKKSEFGKSNSWLEIELACDNQVYKIPQYQIKQNAKNLLFQVEMGILNVHHHSNSHFLFDGCLILCWVMSPTFPCMFCFPFTPSRVCLHPCVSHAHAFPADFESDLLLSVHCEHLHSQQAWSLCNVPTPLAFLPLYQTCVLSKGSKCVRCNTTCHPKWEWEFWTSTTIQVGEEGNADFGI